MSISDRVKRAAKTSALSKKLTSAGVKPGKRQAIFQSRNKTKKVVQSVNAIDQDCVTRVQTATQTESFGSKNVHDDGHVHRDDVTSQSAESRGRYAHAFTERKHKTILRSRTERAHPRSINVKLPHPTSIGEISAQDPRYLKYPAQILIPLFRKAAALRNEMRAISFSDDHGVIQCAERILDVMGRRINYPGLAHIDNLKHYPNAEFSPEAQEAHKNGRKIVVTYALPIRELTRAAIEKVTKGATGDELIELIKEHYRLVLLTSEEIKRLNKKSNAQMVVACLNE